jgi:GNAT superfamily N-acetyltransferase
VRQAAPSDARGLQETCFGAQTLEQVEERLRWCLSEQAKGRMVCLVVERGDRLVATGQLSILRRKGEIGSLYVAPTYRRQEIGTALVRALIEQAKLRSIETLEITANVDQPWIGAWYERLGFAFSRMHDFPGERVAILTMDLSQGDTQ